MRRTALLTIALLAVVAAPSAHAGKAIPKLGPACDNSYLLYDKDVSRDDFRAALLCLINEARKTQKLPALKRAGILEGVAQLQSDTFAATGSASHGTSLSDIGRRFARKGYRPAAYNEGFAAVEPGTTPYAALADMVRRAGVPCSEIFDPRFRDVGIGISVGHGGVVDTVALEFGLRAGSTQPSTNTRPASSCGHPIPAPLVTGAELEPESAPVASATGVSFDVKCVARVACTFTGKVTLQSTKVSVSRDLTIPAGTTQTLTFAFDASAIAAELAATSPAVRLAVDVTAPAQYSDHFDATLKRAPV